MNYQYTKHRFAVFERHGWKCHYCGAEAQVLDHFISLANGGTHDLDNLVPACAPCNGIKASASIEQARERLTLRAIGWPAFTPQQIQWLRSQNFDMRPLDEGKLWFERK